MQFLSWADGLKNVTGNKKYEGKSAKRFLVLPKTDCYQMAVAQKVPKKPYGPTVTRKHVLKNGVFPELFFKPNATK